MSGMRVLHVSSRDLTGARFNGFNWHAGLARRGIESSMAVHWQHASDQAWVKPISARWDSPAGRRLALGFHRARQVLGDERLRMPWANDLLDLPAFQSADVVHLQIVGDSTLDLATMREVFVRKPTVWTWHDLWPVTGHCIQPIGCPEFVNSCRTCPHLERPFRVLRDRSFENRQAKAELFGLPFTLHVTTSWMRSQILPSLPVGVNPVVLPFWLDAETFETPNRRYARASLGLPEEAFVIGVRARHEDYKNTDLLDAALAEYMPENWHVLAIDERGQLPAAAQSGRVHELGWQSDAVLPNFYAAIDVLVVPSLGESFGMMAVEAMVAARPVVGVSGTAVAEVASLNTWGLDVDGRNPMALRAVLDQLASSEERRLQIASEMREFGLARYCDAAFFDKLTALYERAIAQHRGWQL